MVFHFFAYGNMNVRIVIKIPKSLKTIYIFLIVAKYKLKTRINAVETLAAYNELLIITV